MSNPLISVVIGTYNQKDVLKQVLDGFQAQSLDSELFEVVVVDSSSDDGTGQMMSEYPAKFGFNPIVQANEGKAAARNRGEASA